MTSPPSSVAAPPTSLVSAADLRRQRRRLLELIRVNETLRLELRRQRNKLLTANQDQYFLFERLRNYEKCPALQPAQRHQQSDTLTPLSSVTAAGPPDPASRVKRKYRKRRPKGEAKKEERTKTEPDPASAPQFSAGFSKSKQVPIIRRPYNASSSSSSAQSLLLPAIQPATLEEEEELSASSLANSASAISGTDEDEELTIDEKPSFT